MTLTEEEEAIVERFRKMTKMGLPESVVRHKMQAEEVEHHIQEAVFSGGGEDARAADEPEQETAPNNSAEEATIAEDAPKEAEGEEVPKEGGDPSALTPEEEEQASRFRKMLNMGLPPDVVRHKMTGEAVDERVMNAVLAPTVEDTSDPTPSADDGGVEPPAEALSGDANPDSPPTEAQPEQPGEANSNAVENPDTVTAEQQHTPTLEHNPDVSEAQPSIEGSLEEEDIEIEEEEIVGPEDAEEEQEHEEEGTEEEIIDEDVEEGENVVDDEVLRGSREPPVPQQEPNQGTVYQPEMAHQPEMAQQPEMAYQPEMAHQPESQHPYVPGDQQPYRPNYAQQQEPGYEPETQQQHYQTQGYYDPNTGRYIAYNRNAAPQPQGYYDPNTGQYFPGSGNVGYQDNEVFDEEYAQYQPQHQPHQSQTYYGNVGQPFDQVYQQQLPQEQAPQHYGFPKTPQGQVEEERARSRRRCLVCCLVVVLVVFATALCGLGVILGIWLADEDEGDTRVVFATPAPNSPTSPTAPAATTTPPTFPPSTAAPTTAPTLGPVTLETVEQFSGEVGSGHGTSVAASGNWNAISEPELDNGAVRLFKRDAAAGRRLVSTETQGLTGPHVGSRFGADIDFSNALGNEPNLLVGAPQTIAGATNTTTTGAAYFFSFNSDENQWIQEGSQINGGSSDTNDNEAFGSSVAQSDDFRIVIGAPSHGTDNAGRVYTFALEQISGSDTLDWVQLSTTPLLGSGADAAFGSAVDITSTGNTIATGEPGTSSFRIYEWDATSRAWNLSFDLQMSDAVDMGAEVKFLSDDLVAVGAPSASEGAGLILTFQRGTATWTLIGQINGEPGNALGMFGTIDGDLGSIGPEILVGASNGFLQRYDLFDGNFVRRYNEDQGAAITSIDLTSDDPYGVLVGFGGQAASRLFELGASREPPTEPTPAPSPPANTRTWTVTTAGTTPRGEPTDLGSSIAMAGTNFLVTGEPRFGADFIKPGQLVAFERSGPGQAFVNQAIVVDETFGLERFGTAVDMILDSTTGLPLLAAGATRTKGAEQTNARFGAGFYYEYNTSGTFDPVGGTLRGIETLGEAGGLLGFAVALAQTSDGTVRMAVSGPSTSIVEPSTIDVGSVYTYDLIDGMWESLTAEPLKGAEPSSFLGVGMDLSADGLTLVLGAPGSLPVDGIAPGAVLAYSWDETNRVWDSVPVLEGTGVGQESFGSEIQWIQETNGWFAASGPTFDSNRGMVRVFARNDDGSFSPLGDDIVGSQPGDQFGSALCGRNGRFASGSSSGEFSVFEYSAGEDTWDILGNTFTPVENSTVVACAMSDDGSTLAVGTDTFQIVVYDLL